MWRPFKTIICLFGEELFFVSWEISYLSPYKFILTFYMAPPFPSFLFYLMQTYWVEYFCSLIQIQCIFVFRFIGITSRKVASYIWQRWIVWSVPLSASFVVSLCGGRLRLHHAASLLWRDSSHSPQKVKNGWMHALVWFALSLLLLY